MTLVAMAAADDAVGFVGESELFVQGQPRAGNHRERVLFVGRARDAIFARAGRVNEFDLDAGADALDVTVEPDFERIGRRRTAAVIARAVVGAARRVRLDRVGLAEGDVDATASVFQPGMPQA